MNPQLIISDQKMLEAYDRLQDLGLAKNQKEICEAIGVEPQRIYKVRIGKQHFIAEHIRMMAKTYNVNLNFLFGFETRFLTKKAVNKKVNIAHGNMVNLESSRN